MQIEIDATKLIQSSKAHGKNRSGIPAYLIGQVIFEYHILREVLFQVLEEKTEINKADRDIILSALEEAVNVSSVEFVLDVKETQDHLLRTIAHDLKTPLSAAQSGAELIRQSPMSKTTLPLAERVIGQTKKMAEMVDEILDTSDTRSNQRESCPLSECDLEAIAREAIEVMKLTHGDWFVFVSDGPVIGLWDPESLRRMIVNLVNNAIKYRTPETRVTVTIRQSQDEALLEVHNLGNPISAADQAVILNPFRRTQAACTQKGWGLGLACVKSIVDAYSGSVCVESAAEKGTRFVVALPKRPKQSSMAA